MPKAMEKFFLVWTKSTYFQKPLEYDSDDLPVYA